MHFDTTLRGFAAAEPQSVFRKLLHFRWSPKRLCGELEFPSFVSKYSRCGDDDLGVDKLLFKGAVFAFFVRGGHKSAAVALDPFAKTEFVFGRAEEPGLLLGVLTAVVQDQENFSLKISGRPFGP